MHADPHLSQDDSAATLGLLQMASSVRTVAERQFVLLNQSRHVWPYQIAVLWRGQTLCAHSGAGDIEAQGPYAQWLQRLFNATAQSPAGTLSPQDLSDDLAQEWQEWWPEHALVLRAGSGDEPSTLVLLRDVPWLQREEEAISRWLALWHGLNHDRNAATANAHLINWHAIRSAWRQPAIRRKRWLQAATLLTGLCLLPVHLTVRAPGELVPRDPVVLRAAVDGMVRALKVEPNQVVQAGQVLAELDDTGWASRLQVAQHALLTAEAEWRQTSQQALSDPRAKAQLAAAQGKYEERKAEVDYLSQQVQRTVLLAPHAGVVLIQDTGSWPGRTVNAGEVIMKLARPSDQEVEAWLAAGDAIDLPSGASMRLHLTSHPGSPVNAKLRLYAFEAEHRPDLGLGYRLRGTLDAPPTERLGARGTVRIDGPWVPLAYWVFRRPLAAAREATGW
jgi:biotin carboxyl carrier protein